MRKANNTDVKKIMELIEGAKISLREDNLDQWQGSSPNEALIVHQISMENAYVYDDDDILAYAYLSEEEEPTYISLEDKFKKDKKNQYTVHTYCVDRNRRNKGIASDFFTELIDLSRKNGKAALRIDTHEDNYKMLKLVKKMGFYHVGDILINDDGVLKPRVAFELIL